MLVELLYLFSAYCLIAFIFEPSFVKRVSEFLRDTICDRQADGRNYMVKTVCLPQMGWGGGGGEGRVGDITQVNPKDR